MKRRLPRLESWLMLLGGALLLFFLLSRLLSWMASTAAVATYQEERQQPAQTAEKPPEPSPPKIDFSLWAKDRVRAYRRSLTRHLPPPLAILRIPKINLEVPVLDGTSATTMNFGVGRIPGTARPGEPGNIGIAGHRDGFFRGLKDIQTGDTVELITAQRKDVFVVTTIRVTDPEDTSVLNAGQQSSLTLVTCYPFYFAGNAPQRYIVRASQQASVHSSGASP